MAHGVDCIFAEATDNPERDSPEKNTPYMLVLPCQYFLFSVACP